MFFTSCRFISLGLRVCIAPSLTSNVSLHSLLSRRFDVSAVAVETRDAFIEDEGLETVAEITRVFIVEEEEGGGGGGGAALSCRFSLRKLMERCRDTETVITHSNTYVTFMLNTFPLSNLL